MCPAAKAWNAVPVFRFELNELVLLPCERNPFKPPAASKNLRQKGAQRGVRLILLERQMTCLPGSA